MLTDAQRDLVEKNHNLIYWYMNLKGLDHEEWYGLIAIELCVAVQRYDKGKGSLSNLFKLICDNRVATEFEKNSRKKRSHNGHFELDDYTHMGDHNNVEAEVLLNELLDSDLKGILQMKLDGYNQSEIAEELNLSQGYVSQIIKGFREEFNR